MQIVLNMFSSLQLEFPQVKVLNVEVVTVGPKNKDRRKNEFVTYWIKRALQISYGINILKEIEMDICAVLTELNHANFTFIIKVNIVKYENVLYLSNKVKEQ